jgi:glycogen phosphorylase
VELYADRIDDNGPIRQEMTLVRSLAGVPHREVYRASVPATRAITDYTARIIPHGSGVAVPLETAHILWQR